MRFVLLLAVLASACATSKPAAKPVSAGPSNGPRVHERTVEYEVTGNTSTEIRASLDSLGPTDDSGRHDALTKWFVKWTFDYDKQPDACRFVNIKVNVNVEISMPHWDEPVHNGPLNARWQSYIDALRTHERGHVQNGLDAAQIIWDKLPTMPPEPDCDVANTKANEMGNHELDLARAKDKEYDAQTKHGETQGATFR